MDNCVDHVGSAPFASKFDLPKCYWQFPIFTCAREISAFVTPNSFLQYSIVPLGMLNSPSTLQWLVNHVLSRLTGCKAYVDNVVVYSASVLIGCQKQI